MSLFQTPLTDAIIEECADKGDAYTLAEMTEHAKILEKALNVANSQIENWSREIARWIPNP